MCVVRTHFQFSKEVASTPHRSGRRAQAPEIPVYPSKHRSRAASPFRLLRTHHRSFETYESNIYRCKRSGPRYSPCRFSDKDALLRAGHLRSQKKWRNQSRFRKRLSGSRPRANVGTSARASHHRTRRSASSFSTTASGWMKARQAVVGGADRHTPLSGSFDDDTHVNYSKEEITTRTIFAMNSHTGQSARL